MLIIDKEQTLRPHPVSYKQFGQTYQVKNHAAIKNLYGEYLELSGKRETMTLTNIDLWKIDQIII